VSKYRRHAKSYIKTCVECTQEVLQAHRCAHGCGMWVCRTCLTTHVTFHRLEKL
jgi:hypothetical protein